MEGFVGTLVLLVLFKSSVCFQFVDNPHKIFTKGPCSQAKGDVCIEIGKCPYFSHLLNSTRIPRPPNVIRVIRKHQCGFSGDVPKVCCTLHKMDPPDVANHPNLQLLPRNDCGPVLSEYRIFSGSSTTLLEFPWMALLAYNTSVGLDFRCGGTVINDRYILTAAHCIFNMTLIGVRLGEHNIYTKEDCDENTGNCSPPVQDFNVEDVIVHPDFLPSPLNNDIALLRLATPANFSQANVQPICLPFGEISDTTLDGKMAEVAGWGVTETGYKSAVLLKVSLPVIPNKICRRIYKKFTPITDRKLCAGGYKGQDSCGGDSGGPLKRIGFIEGNARYIQHGIVSYGPRNCGSEGQPGVYTRISHYIDWILDNIKA